MLIHSQNRVNLKIDMYLVLKVLVSEVYILPLTGNGLRATIPDIGPIGIDSSIILSKVNKIANQRHQTRTSHREVEKGTASPFQAFNAGLNEETGDREYLRRCNVFQDGSARVDLI